MVDGGSVISFTPAISAQHRVDVVHSFLLAQLAADRKFGRHTQPLDWYAVHAHTLEIVGWVVEAHQGFTPYRPNAASFTAVRPVLETLGAICDAREQESVAAALDILSRLGERDRSAALFEKESHLGTAGNFQIVAAGEAEGDAVAKLGRFHFTTGVEVHRLLLAEFSGGTEFLRGSGILRLDNDVYGPLRDSVAAKLGRRVGDGIVPLPGAPLPGTPPLPPGPGG
ncbi:hypothetical protein [Streptomyces roseoverticillatus]|uniref:Uncharacterized protein n=1 Tax=Streptomyces roseoverticillatus TaxID=66429 RepID=A0ABV3IT08_9ACTN